jgi:sarcosine oxidase gamma subunit
VIARIAQAFTVGQCARTMVDDAVIGAVLLATAVLAFVAYVCGCLAWDAWNSRR